MSAMFYKPFSLLIPTILTVVIVGCTSTSTQTQATDSAPAQIGIVNHTGNFIYSASVDGAGGGGMDRWGAGVANICCAKIPRIWYAGMKVRVRWDMPEGHTHVVKEKVVDVERYDTTGSIYIHFFPNDEVRVVVTSVVPYNPAHPIKLTEQPQ
ncbi:DUF3304 domain-containing protein [Duganella sp. FT109W]|uniref:DUF3304 domain-containing protein n=1 Tax=Duganella margarita TaxID=2692170 RepID=A0ABW9WLN9_9BURK|nr:DUF3304 domain-containing protein [Duganella margarita]